MKSFLSSIWRGMLFAPALFQGGLAQATPIEPTPPTAMVRDPFLQKTPFVYSQPTSYALTTAQKLSEGLIGVFSVWPRPNEKGQQNSEPPMNRDMPEESKNMLIQKVSALVKDAKRRGNACAALGVVYRDPPSKKHKLMTLAQISFPPETQKITVSNHFSHHASWDDPESAPQWTELALALLKKNRDPVMVWALEFSSWDMCRKNGLAPPGATI